MYKRQLLELIRVNLLYVNPQFTNKAREKGKKGKRLTIYLLSQNLLSGLIFLLIYGFAMFAMNFVKLPGFFTYYVALFGMLGLTQSISVIYNIFFEGNDLQVFLPLPFGQGQVFSAKILVVALTIIPFVFPLLVMFILTGWRADLGILLTIIISILLFSLFLIILFCLASLIVFGLARTAVFKKHRKTVSSILLGSSMLIAFAGIMWMNHQTGTIENELTDRHPISILLPFYDAASQPLSQQGLLGWGILAITALGFFLAVKQLIVPKLTEQLTDSNSEFKIKRTHKKNQNVHQLLFSYNAQLVKEPNLIMQVLSSSLLTPIIFILAFALGGEIKLTDLDNKLIGVVFLVGIALAFLTVNQTSFISNLISLDQENFLFIRSLPISMNQYLKEKFRFGWILQSFLTGGIALLSGLSFRLPLFFIPSLLFGSLFGCYLLSLRYFARDYRLLLLNWTNINQLFNRGSGSLGLVATMMGSLIISIILIVLYGMLALFYPFWLVNIPVIGLVLILSALWIVYYQRTFWKKFE
ncbi:ABC transporter [Enterococcus faecium]